MSDLIDLCVLFAGRRVATPVTFTIPPYSENLFLFKRDFYGAIRSAISQAHVAGQIDTLTAVTCLKAIPPAAPDLSAA